MPRLLGAPGNLQELVELQHSALAAGPSLATLVEDGVARVVDAPLVVASRRATVGGTAASATTRRVRRDLHIRVVGLGLLDDRLGGGSGRSRGRRDGNGWALVLLLGRRGSLLDLLWLRGGGIIDGGMLAGCAWRDGEEFLEGQDAGLAAFPAWTVSNVASRNASYPVAQ